MSSTRQRYGPTSGTFFGWVGLLAVVVVVALVVGSERSAEGLRIAMFALIFGWLVWCYMLRPRIIIDGDDLLLRNPMADTIVPLSLISEVSVRTVTAVFVDDARYVGIAVGHPARRLLNQSVGRSSKRQREVDNLPDTSISGRLLADKLPEFVERQIIQASENARTAGPASGEVRVQPAVPELAVLGVFVVVLALSFVV